VIHRRREVLDPFDVTPARDDDLGGMLAPELLGVRRPSLAVIQGSETATVPRRGPRILDPQLDVDRVPVGVEHERLADPETVGLAGEHEPLRALGRTVRRSG